MAKNNLNSNDRVRFLLNPMGSAGDVHPYLGAAQELIARGHDAILLTNPAFEKSAQQLNVPFVPIGEPVDWQAVGRDEKIHRPTLAWKEAIGWAAINPMRDVFDNIKRLHIADNTVLVSPVWSFGCRLAAERLSIPHVNLLLNTMVLRSAYDTPAIPMLYLRQWMPKWLKRYMFWLADRFAIDPVLKKPLNIFRRELGLKPVSRLMHRWWFSGDLVLALFDRAFAPPQFDWPIPVKYVGHPRFDPAGNSETLQQVIEFANAGTPPVVFVPGSVGPGGPEFFRNAVAACQQVGCRAIFLDRNDCFVPLDLPSTIRHFHYVPLRELIAHCAAIVHSGCAGTMNHAMAAGIPHVVWPRVNDQFDNARRLERLQLGVVLRTKLPTQADLTTALQSVLRNVFYNKNAQNFSHHLQGLDPLTLLVDELEKVGQPRQIIPSATPREQPNRVAPVLAD